MKVLQLQPNDIELVLESRLFYDEKKKSTRRGGETLFRESACGQMGDPAKGVGRAFVGNNERQQHPRGIREEGAAAWHKTVSGKKVLFESRDIWELSVSVHG